MPLIMAESSVNNFFCLFFSYLLHFYIQTLDIVKLQCLKRPTFIFLMIWALAVSLKWLLLKLATSFTASVNCVFNSIITTRTIGCVMLACLCLTAFISIAFFEYVVNSRARHTMIQTLLTVGTRHKKRGDDDDCRCCDCALGSALEPKFIGNSYRHCPLS